MWGYRPVLKLRHRLCRKPVTIERPKAECKPHAIGPQREATRVAMSPSPAVRGSGPEEDTEVRFWRTKLAPNHP